MSNTNYPRTHLFSLLFWASALLLGFGENAGAQPTVLGTQLVNGSYTTYDLTDRGNFRQVRLQAASGASSGQRNWEFATGSAAIPNYNPNWRPNVGSPLLSGYNVKIDPVTQDGSARYNTDPPGQSGTLPAVTNGHYYTVNVGENGGGDNFMSILETTFNPKTITGVSQAPTNGSVYVQQAVTVTVTISAALSTGEVVYIRYTTNSFGSSSFAQATGAGTSLTATIPGQAAGANVQYYVLSTKSTITPTHADADFQTLELNNNGGSNFSYTVNGSYGNQGAGGACSGLWSDADCWLNNAVPPSGATISILENLTMDVSPTVASLSISASKMLTSEAGQGRTLTVNGGGTFANAGTFTANDGTVAFVGTGTVSGSVIFNNVTLSGGGTDFGSAATLNGTLTINPSGFVNAGAPTYALGSVLKYNTGTTYGRRSEWDNKIPHHVQISNNTNLDLGANSGTGTARTMNGNLTIDANCGFFMDFGDNDMTASLTVNGNIVNNGIFSLSEQPGGDLNVKGDFEQNGTFNCRERAVQFNGIVTQDIRGTGSVFIDYFNMNNGNGVVLERDVTIDNELQLNTGNITVGDFNLILQQNLTGGSNSSYVVTNASGKLTRNDVGSTPKLFPIGPSASYNPVTMANTGTVDHFSVNVGTAVTSPFSPGSMVNRQWDISEAVSGGSLLELTFQWNGSSPETDNGFDCGGEVVIGHYNGSSWDQTATTSKSCSAPFSATADEFADLSPFAVGNQSPLPVELTHFSAEKTEQTALLTWRTASELNNAHFHVQRSADSKIWQNLGTVQGQGTTLEAQSYTFADREPLGGLNYYRLEQVDFDGASEFSTIVSIDFRGNSEPQLFPNPAGELLFVKLPDGREGIHTVRIFDVQGRLVFSENWQPGSGLEVQALQHGRYLLRLEGEAGRELWNEHFLKK